jgi:hypothetical protein
MTTKTVFYSFESLKNTLNDTLTSFTEITVELPESGKSFSSVKAILNFMDDTDVAANYTRRELRLGLNGDTKTTIANTSTYTNSGENIASVMTYDFTNLFNSEWSGTSMTCQADIRINQTGTISQAYVSLVLQITYESDESSNTQLKTVFIPLNAPVGDLSTTKPATATDTISALNTYLPEDSKSYKNIFITLQGNTNRASATNTDIFIQLDNITSDSFFSQGALASDIFYTYIYKLDGIINPSVDHSFFIWSDPLGRFCHPQTYLTVTYTYNESQTTSILNSLVLPMEIESVLGFSATKPQYASRDFFIQEPGNITTNRIAFFAFWEQAVPQTGLNLKIGSGNFITYTDRANVVSGNNAAMIRGDSNFTLSRGRNTLDFTCYTTVSAANMGVNPNGFWIINYTSDKHSLGSFTHNTSVFDLIGAINTSAASASRVFTNYVTPISNLPFYLNSIGINYTYVTNTTGLNGGVSAMVERRPNSDGGVQKWETLFVDIVKTDAESGIHNIFSQSKNIFKRWLGDNNGTSRLDSTLSRDYFLLVNVTSFDSADIIYTYHGIYYTLQGTLIGFNSSEVNIQLRRYETDEVVLSKTQVGDGNFDFIWYDNTELVYICTSVNGNIVAKSNPGIAGTDFFDVDISGNFNITIELN